MQRHKMPSLDAMLSSPLEPINNLLSTYHLDHGFACGPYPDSRHYPEWAKQVLIHMQAVAAGDKRAAERAENKANLIAFCDPDCESFDKNALD